MRDTDMAARKRWVLKETERKHKSVAAALPKPRPLVRKPSRVMASPPLYSKKAVEEAEADRARREEARIERWRRYLATYRDAIAAAKNDTDYEYLRTEWIDVHAPSEWLELSEEALEVQALALEKMWELL
jgi:hypothetical protein